MKKKLVISSLAICLACGVYAQVPVTSSNLPGSIQTSFKGQYPNVSGSEWRMKDNLYRVNFSQDGVKQMNSYDASGKLLSTGTSVKETELPAAIGSSINSGYAGRSINEIYKIDKNGTPSYWITLKGSPETKIMYDANGQQIKDKTNW